MEKEKKVVIVTHGELAKGLVSALKIIVGDVADIQTVCGYTTPDFDLDQTIQSIMNQHDFNQYELVVCTDMMGGSVNNGFVKYLGQYPFHLVTNTNLAFLVDLLLTPGCINAQVLTSKVSDDLVSVKYVNGVVNSMDDLDDL